MLVSSILKLTKRILFSRYETLHQQTPGSHVRLLFYHFFVSLVTYGLSSRTSSTATFQATSLSVVFCLFRTSAEGQLAISCLLSSSARKRVSMGLNVSRETSKKYNR